MEPVSAYSSFNWSTNSCRIITLVLGILSGFRWASAQTPFVIQQPNDPAIGPMASSALGRKAVVIWVSDQDQVLGSVVDAVNRVQSPIVTILTGLNAGEEAKLSMDCCGDTCQLGFRDYAIPDNLWASDITVNGTEISQVAVPTHSTVRLLSPWTGIDAVCSCNECSLVFWGYGGSPSSISLVRRRRRFDNTTFVEQILGTEIWPAGGPAGLYVDGQFATVVAQQPSLQNPVANITINFWTAAGQEALPPMLISDSKPLERLAPAAGCFSNSRCLVVWFEKPDIWREVGRLIAKDGTPLSSIPSRVIGVVPADLQVAVSGGLALIGQSNQSVVTGRWVTDTGAEFSAFSEAGTTDGETVFFSISPHPRGATLFWTSAQNQLSAKWIPAPSIPTTTPPTLPTSTQAASAPMKSISTSDPMRYTTVSPISRPSTGIPAISNPSQERSVTSQVAFRSLSSTQRSVPPEKSSVTRSTQSPIASSLVPSPSLGLTLGIAGGVCAVTSSVVSGIIIWKCRHKQDPLADGESDYEARGYPQPPVSSDAEDADTSTEARSSYSTVGLNKNQYKQLQLYPKSHSHYIGDEELQKLNRESEQYESLKVTNASKYAIWPQN